MDDIYTLNHLADDTNWITRIDGVTGEKEDLFRGMKLNLDQIIEVTTALIEAQERMKQGLLAEMRDFLNRRELNYVRARSEGSTYSARNQSVPDGNVGSGT